MASTRPATGERLTCTLNTFMKILMQGRTSPVMGSAFGSTRITRPSAGLTAMSSSEGTTRSGSRKKCPENQVSTRKTSASGKTQRRERQRRQREQKEKRQPFRRHTDIAFSHLSSFTLWPGNGCPSRPDKVKRDFRIMTEKGHGCNPASPFRIRPG